MTMSDTRPSSLPGQAPQPRGAASSAGAPGAPSAEPPARAAAAAGSDCGCQGTAPRGLAAALPPIATAAASLTAPSLRPGGTSAGAVAATWQNNVHVLGMWSINQDRNAFAYLDTVGWRGLSGASPSALVAMNMLAAHAFQTGAIASMHEADDGRISQLYVW
jgi:hypothetical protein